MVISVQNNDHAHFGTTTTRTALQIHNKKSSKKLIFYGVLLFSYLCVFLFEYALVICFPLVSKSPFSSQRGPKEISKLPSPPLLGRKTNGMQEEEFSFFGISSIYGKLCPSTQGRIFFRSVFVVVGVVVFSEDKE